METREMYLYKVSYRYWNSPVYVAAENQQEAVKKASFGVENQDDECKMSVDFVDMVTV
jgi:hypothetical protein